MNRFKCPHFGPKLGNFLYADTYPRCHEPLKQNLARESAPKPNLAKPKSWPVGALFEIHPICGNLEGGIPPFARLQ